MNRDNLKHKLIKDASGTDDNNSGFVLGIISAILLIVFIGTLLMFNNKQVQRIIGENINVDPENSFNETQNTGTLSCCAFNLYIASGQDARTTITLTVSLIQSSYTSAY